MPFVCEIFTLGSLLGKLCENEQTMCGVYLNPNKVCIKHRKLFRTYRQTVFCAESAPNLVNIIFCKVF